MMYNACSRRAQLEVSSAIAEAHWLVLETGNEGLPTAFLVVLTFWLIVIFLTFGLLSPYNGTVSIDHSRLRSVRRRCGLHRQRYGLPLQA